MASNQIIFDKTVFDAVYNVFVNNNYYTIVQLCHSKANKVIFSDHRGFCVQRIGLQLLLRPQLSERLGEQAIGYTIKYCISMALEKSGGPWSTCFCQVLQMQYHWVLYWCSLWDCEILFYSNKLSAANLPPIDYSGPEKCRFAVCLRGRAFDGVNNWLHRTKTHLGDGSHYDSVKFK